MNFEELMGYTKESVQPPSCYVCGTTIDVRPQDVILSVEPFTAITLPVCFCCSNAVSRVVQLEDRIEDLEERIRQGVGLYDAEFQIVVVSDYEA